MTSNQMICEHLSGNFNQEFQCEDSEQEEDDTKRSFVAKFIADVQDDNRDNFLAISGRDNQRDDEDGLLLNPNSRRNRRMNIVPTIEANNSCQITFEPSLIEEEYQQNNDSSIDSKRDLKEGSENAISDIFNNNQLSSNNLNDLIRQRDFGDNSGNESPIEILIDDPAAVKVDRAKLDEVVIAEEMKVEDI